ncbi:MAG TPA: hypothetical protein VD978_22240 [Azospirillum sp.]|nr:hypothetical protein [Azospirillum sp.]
MHNPVSRSLRATALLLAVGTLAACATGQGSTTPYQPWSATESHALQIVNAADLLGLRDADAPKDATAPGGSSSLVQAGAFGTLNYLSPPPGFGSVAAGALGFASFFFSGPAPEEWSRTPSLLVWMPRSEAATADEAWHKLNAMVQRELAAVLSETRLPSGYRLEKEEKLAIAFRPGYSLAPTRYTSTRTLWKIRGGDCDDPKVQCQYQVSLIVPPVERAAPSVLGGYPAWTYIRTEGLAGISPTFVDRREFREKYRAVFPDLEVLRKLSARLPAWAFIYIGPDSVAYMNEEVGKPTLLRFPVILSKGEPVYFVRGGKGIVPAM